MFTRRRLLISAGALGAFGTMAACGPNADSGDDSGGVRIYWWGGDLRNGMTREALGLFSESHPDLPVSPEYSEWTGYWDKLATQTAGGDAPDVIQMDEAYIDSYGTRGSLLDLESVSDLLDLSDMDEDMLETGRLADGTLVGAPLGIGIFSVGVNPDVLDQAGIEMPDDTTWTWKDFGALCAQVSEWAASAGEDIVGLDFLGTDAAELGMWARQSGQQLFPREDETLISKDTITSFLEYARELIETDAAPQAAAQVEDAAAGVEQGRFATNRSAFHFQFHTQIQTFQASSGSPLKLLRVPARTSGDHQMVNKASMYWSISAATTNPDDSATLIDFLLRDPEAAKVLKIERGVTAFPELQTEIESVLTENEMVSLDFARDMQAEVVRPPLVTPTSGVGFGDEFSRLAEESFFGNRPPSDVADEILTQLEGMQPEA
ncbi:ABC transporter substrate-binding protein [Brachybacterium sacelli]|uniref:Multiple sugar transport system substrate-binding protein n=1 Tax=Brachybacterium sacelli TaxID=173364 RepID=A0ABS4WZ98_9MICO|nr:ABC transporter substrate-binding protein [Brachybacterium sacelli]MBP2381525.1 multiple sugar transport system substrate-binding protein [Brachybacterium sacelli]